MKANEFFEPMLLFIKTVESNGTNAKIQKLFFPTFIPKGNDRTDTFEYPAPEIDGYDAPSSTLTMTFYEPNIVNKTEYDYDGVWSCFKPNLTTSPVSVADENTLPVYTRKSGDTGTVRDAWYTDTGYSNGIGCGGIIYGASFTPGEVDNDNIYYNPILSAYTTGFDWSFGGYKHSFIPFCGKPGVRYTYTIPEDFWSNLGYSLTETIFDWEFESVNNDFYFVPTVYKHGTDEKIWIEQGVMNSDDEYKDEKLSRDVNTVFAYAGELPKIMDFPKTIEVNTDGLSGRFYGTVSVPFALPGTATTIDMPSLENYTSTNPLAADNAGNYNRQTVVMDKIDKEDVNNDFMGCTVNGWVNDLLSESTLPTDKAHYNTALNITDNSQDIMWAAIQSYGILIDNEYYNYNVMFISKNGEKKQLSELPPIPGISFIVDNSQDPALPYNYEIDAALDDNGYPTDPFMADFVIADDDTPIPYPGAIGLGDLVILSANPKLNKYVNGRLDPINRVFDNLGLKVLSDIVDGNGRREVVVTTSRGDYHPTPYDVLVRNTSVHWSADNVPESGYMITSSMNPFAPYQGYFHQDFPLFLESYDGDKYTFVNLFGLKIENLRSKDETGNSTYDWIKSVYDDFLKYHSFMLCYYLGFTNHGHNYMSFYKYDPSDGKDWGGENITQDSASVVDVSSVITSSITAKAHGSYIREGFLVDDKGQPYYYGVVYYDYMRTSDPNDGDDFEKRVVTNINLKNEHVVQMSTTGRNYSDNPRIVRLYRQDANNSDNLTLLGFYAIDENAHVKQITDMTDINAPQYSIKDIIIDSNTTIDSAVFQNVKYILTERDLDISVVLDMDNRYSASMLACFMDDKSNLTPFFHTYNGWVRAYFDDKPDSIPVLLQFQQIDFVAQTLLLATNNDIVLKERVK